MAGNSWLATTQWFIAAEQPPHLTCMTPLEGLGDYYRESICRDSISDHAFWDVLIGWACGPGMREDLSAMVDKYGTWNDYLEDKKPKLRNITIPMYETLFLDATNGSLGHRKPPSESVVEYQAELPSDDGCSLIHTFEEYTELCSVSKAKVYMSTIGHDDMDVYVVLRKLDKNGKALWHQHIRMEDLPKGTTVDDISNENIWRYIGPNGRLRASHRAIANEALEGLDQGA
ncbi:acylase and diesterase protein [Colletotrichum acutatum]